MSTVESLPGAHHPRSSRRIRTTAARTRDATTGFNAPKGFAVDESFVFMAMSTGPNATDVGVEIYRAPKCGGPALLLARSQIFGPGLVAAGDYLYWGRDKDVVRTAK